MMLYRLRSVSSSTSSSSASLKSLLYNKSLARSSILSLPSHSSSSSSTYSTLSSATTTYINQRCHNLNINSNRYYTITNKNEQIEDAEIVYKQQHHMTIDQNDKRFTINSLEAFNNLKPSDRLVELSHFQIPSVESIRNEMLERFEKEKVERNKPFLEHLPHLADMFKNAQETAKQFNELSDHIKHKRGLEKEGEESNYEDNKENGDTTTAPTNDNDKAEFIEIKGKHGEVTSKRGTKYKGGLTDEGVPHGPGEYETSSGEIYIGEFVNGKRHGAGRFIFVDASSYDGFWANDKFEGLGVFQRRDGYSHDGEWKNGMREGYGVLMSPDIEIRGEWHKDNLVRGHEIRKDNKYEYYGEYFGEDWHGKGRVAYIDGTIFEGSHKNALRHGKGRLISTNQLFECNWVDGIPNGHGRCIANDLFVEGHWIDGDCVKGSLIKVGFGVYEGGLKNLRPNGEGAELQEDGSMYIGGYVDGKRHGFGLYRWSDGTVYQGEWVDGDRCGLGRMIFRNGKGYEGYFNDREGENQKSEPKQFDLNKSSL